MPIMVLLKPMLSKSGFLLFFLAKVPFLTLTMFFGKRLGKFRLLRPFFGALQPKPFRYDSPLSLSHPYSSEQKCLCGMNLTRCSLKLAPSQLLVNETLPKVSYLILIHFSVDYALTKASNNIKTISLQTLVELLVFKLNSIKHDEIPLTSARIFAND